VYSKIEFRNTFFRWTNIPQSDFTPPAEILKEELLASYNGPLLRDLFFIKFPWVLHDILVLFKGISLIVDALCSLILFLIIKGN